MATPESLAAGQLAAFRLKKLARYLIEKDDGADFGKVSRAARRLGINQSYLTKILSGERASIGMDTIDAAVKSVPIRRVYFTRPSLKLALAHGGDGDHVDPADYLLEPGADDASENAREATNERWQVAARLAADFAAAIHRGDVPSEHDALTMASVVLGDPIVEAAQRVAQSGDAVATVNAATRLALLLTAPRRADASVPVGFVRVRPKPGLLCPWPHAGGHFIGMRLAGPDDPDAAIVHRSDARSYVSLGPVLVPDTPYFQRMIAQGDLLRDG